MSLKLLTMFRNRASQQKRQRQRRQRLQQFQQQLPTTWLLISVICTLLQPLCTHSTPIQTYSRALTASAAASPLRQDRASCAHESIAKLIKTSPVILKALGAHIFTDDDFNDPTLPLDGLSTTDGLNSHGRQNEILATATLDATAKITTATMASPSSTSATKISNKNDKDNNNNGPALVATMPTTSPEMGSILITLTPETIYKGASLLKMSLGPENGARSDSFANLNAGDSATSFESQINATLQPAHCFEGNLLKLLPTELIVFGKLVTKQEQQQLWRPQDPQKQFLLPHSIKWQEDLLHISINGFHRWSPKFENYIWKHLGWDDWSDFTLCSVTCGKGVQQRFRRCLLDNPMVNLNMNANLNAVNMDSLGFDEDDDDVIMSNSSGSSDDNNILDDGYGGVGGARRDDHTDMVDNDITKPDRISDDDDDVDDDDGNDMLKIRTDDGGRTQPAVTVIVSETIQSTPFALQYNKNELAAEVNRKSLPMTVDAAHTPTSAPESEQEPTRIISENMSPRTTATQPTITTVVDELRAQRTQGYNEHMKAEYIPNDVDGGTSMRKENIKDFHNEMDKRIRKLNKKRITTKQFETMSCEGYNIEQRDCNMFECSDDISDLLKFYKKTQFSEDALQTPASTVQISDASNEKSAAATTTTNTYNSVSGTSENVSDVGMDSTPSSTTPANMGYIKSWRNSLNFTILITLRVKNDSKATATIFSIRNATHNLYLDQCQDGLRLYLERDKSTEMLPVKFHLYDYRWHQIAISVQNGDFISIFVDCSWTNSYVVSKRLFTLPLDADAEIGRGFSGELQQLLLLPDNQERHQCSTRRTSINEVKRYIIDTFIGDYGN